MEDKMERQYRLHVEKLEEEISNLQNLVTKQRGDIERLELTVKLLRNRRRPNA